MTQDIVTAYSQMGEISEYVYLPIYVQYEDGHIRTHIRNTRVTESFNILSRYVTIWETGDNNFSNQIVHRKGKIAWSQESRKVTAERK